ncbi:MAG: ferredoxin [archaeon]|nr:ferredoxin [archaeon]
MSSDNDEQNSKRKGLGYFRSKDPLVYIGIIVLIMGIAFTVYGFVPINTPNYQRIPQPVYISITNGTQGFISADQAAIIAKPLFNGTADNVVCFSGSPDYTCYGEIFTGMVTVTSNSAKEYGGAMDAVGIAAFYLGYMYEPLTLKKRELHSIRIRVDEDICIANAVCVELAPKVFQLKKQNTPSLLAPLAYVVDPFGASNDEILQAAQMCPTGAIIIEDEETGERIHPPLPNG